MITLILKNASLSQLSAAVQYTADHLHIPESMVTSTVAVAYICKHFEMGAYTGWDGFTEMIGA